MATTDITIKPERRLCTVNGEYGYFHCWAFRTLGHLKKVDYTSEAIAIIEFEDRVACIYPWEVKFVDEENHELHWIDDADHWRCPVCGEYVTCPSVYVGCKCPVCGFQDEKDKEKTE